MFGLAFEPVHQMEVARGLSPADKQHIHLGRNCTPYIAIFLTWLLKHVNELSPTLVHATSDSHTYGVELHILDNLTGTMKSLTPSHSFRARLGVKSGLAGQA